MLSLAIHFSTLFYSCYLVTLKVIAVPQASNARTLVSTQLKVQYTHLP